MLIIKFNFRVVKCTSYCKLQYIFRGKNPALLILALLRLTTVPMLGNPLIVYMNVSVLAFPSIETMKLSFTSDFFLNLRWYDLRVSLQDLNVVTTLNILRDDS